MMGSLRSDRDEERGVLDATSSSNCINPREEKQEMCFYPVDYLFPFNFQRHIPIHPEKDYM